MSSFIGHGLVAFAIGKGLREKTNFRHQWMWQCFLLFCAFAPDIDYIFKWLDSVHNNGLRITHSIAFSLFLPILGMFYLSIFDQKNVYVGGLQACLAGLSHLILDSLVGSRNADPLLYPFLSEKFRLPFGILPSAGALSLSNYYFYRNLLIECGILVPTFLIILSIWGKLKINKIVLVLAIIILLIFLTWSINLTR